MNGTPAVDTEVRSRAWTRTGLWEPGRAPDTTSRVVWIQAQESYCDLRRPADHRPGHTQAFAGRLLCHGDHHEWTHLFESGAAWTGRDAGHLHIEGPLLIETGVHSPYREHWRPLEPGPAARAGALHLHDPDTGTGGLLLWAGDRFGLVRDRAGPPTPGRALLDTEVSVGRIGPDGWRITASNIARCAGTDPAPERDGTRGVRIGPHPGQGSAHHRYWTVRDSDPGTRWPRSTP